MRIYYATPVTRDEFVQNHPVNLNIVKVFKSQVADEAIEIYRFENDIFAVKRRIIVRTDSPLLVTGRVVEGRLVADKIIKHESTNKCIYSGDFCIPQGKCKFVADDYSLAPGESYLAVAVCGFDAPDYFCKCGSLMTDVDAAGL